MNKDAYVRQPDSAHFYLLDGTPLWEVEMATKPGVMRPPTIRDARKLMAVPSVTTIIKSGSPQAGLQVYKNTQLVMSALTTPRDPNISDQEFIDLVVRHSNEHARDAATIGSEVHWDIAAFLNGLHPEKHEEILEYFMDWCDEFGIPWKTPLTTDLYEVEKSCVSMKHGYACMNDFICEIDGKFNFFDWKTQDFKPNKKGELKCKFYPEMAVQLVANAVAAIEFLDLKVFPDQIVLNSVVIDRKTGTIEHKAWEENDEWFDAFLMVFNVYKSRLGKNFNPVKEIIEQSLKE